MLLWNLGLFLSDPLLFFLLVAVSSGALLIAITFHEFSHALVAYRLGDDTGKRLGRLSLNPKVHLDPVGTLMLFLVGFGWGRPVPINPYLLREGARSGMALVALAGPLANLVVAAAFALLIRLGLIVWHSPLQYPLFHRWEVGWLAADIMGYIILYNIILALFNLIPIAPLDGFKVAVGALPRGLANSLERTERYGPVILLLVIIFGYITSFLWFILRAAMDLLATLLIGRGF